MNKRAMLLLVGLSVYLAFYMWSVVDYGNRVAVIDRRVDVSPYGLQWYVPVLVLWGLGLIGLSYFLLERKWAWVLAISIMVFMALIGVAFCARAGPQNCGLR